MDEIRELDRYAKMQLKYREYGASFVHMDDYVYAMDLLSDTDDIIYTIIGKIKSSGNIVGRINDANRLGKWISVSVRKGQSISDDISFIGNISERLGIYSRNVGYGFKSRRADKFHIQYTKRKDRINGAEQIERGNNYRGVPNLERATVEKYIDEIDSTFKENGWELQVYDDHYSVFDSRGEMKEYTDLEAIYDKYVRKYFYYYSLKDSLNLDEILGREEVPL